MYTQMLARQSNRLPINSIYVFGERNSGTNYVNSLVLRNCRSSNFDSLFNAKNKAAFGWKHGFPTMLGTPDDVLAIAVYREPIDWLHSLHRAPWHTPAHLRECTFSQFIRSEWVSLIDDEGFGIDKSDGRWGHELLADRDPLTGDRFANAMRMRNAKNRGFASLDKRFANVLRVTYETVAANPQGFLNMLCYTYNLQREGDFDPIPHDRATPARGLFQRKALPETSATDMDFIRQELDLEGERMLGYDLLQAAHSIAA